MAAGADLPADRLVGRPRDEGLAAGARHRGLVIGRMNVLLHYKLSATARKVWGRAAQNPSHYTTDSRKGEADRPGGGPRRWRAPAAPCSCPRAATGCVSCATPASAPAPCASSTASW